MRSVRGCRITVKLGDGVRAVGSSDIYRWSLYDRYMERHTPTLPSRRKNAACCTVVSCSLSEPTTTSLAERLKAVADPTRLRLLDMLVQQADPLCVCDITPHFEQHQPTISHHLKLLRDAGLVDTDKRGIWAYYWATETGKKTLTTVTSLG